MPILVISVPFLSPVFGSWYIFDTGRILDVGCPCICLLVLIAVAFVVSRDMGQLSWRARDIMAPAVGEGAYSDGVPASVGGFGIVAYP